jgi:hypothetical protein
MSGTVTTSGRALSRPIMDGRRGHGSVAEAFGG